MDYLYKELRKHGAVKLNAPLAKYTTFKIGGPADLLVEVESREALVNVLNVISAEGVEFFIMGGGSNILFPDEGMRGVVVRVKSEKLKVKSDVIEVDAGVSLGKVVEAAVGAGLGGFEWAAGIPGSVGGAVRGNAGARYAFTGGEMRDSVVNVVTWSNGEMIEFSNEECKFGYRDSVFKHSSDVVLGTTIRLTPGANKQESLEMTQKIIAERKGKQSSEPSAGSFFKNVMLGAWKRDMAELPERFRNYKKIASGWLIEQVGLKGYRVGNAMISNEHANFIVNKGGATQADVLRIVEEVQGRVYSTYEIEVEPEVQIVRI